MKKWLLRLLGFVMVLAILVFVFRGKIYAKMFESYISPTKAFAEYTPPLAPDYADDNVWASLPTTKDGADFVPQELQGVDEKSDVAVFFVHPTTFVSKAGWNGPLDEARVLEYTDGFVMQGQASAYNGCCDIYAPRYRQATLWSFWVIDGDGKKALDLAYTDVERAFDEFLDRIGTRPFILAGHSQGTYHLEELLKQRVTGTPLRERLVAAYLVGMNINTQGFAKAVPDIAVCESAAQTGCYVSWNAKGPKAESWGGEIGATCVNPLSWKADKKSIDATDNIGSLGLSPRIRFEQAVTGAQCLDDKLLVGPFATDIFDKLPMDMGKDNFHVLDYALFYASIRQNAILRTQRYKLLNEVKP
ncbi:MAG: hypothetical protein COA43_07730 [Robiginitomaculum sp.]|nr:MAG: hypothetical protein COA43_07730 [Robiginitomaculum sp.]